MIQRSSCMHFGPTQNHIMTVRTSQKDRADKAKELKKWIRQQEEELRKLHGNGGSRITPTDAGISSPHTGPIRSCFPPTDSATSTSSLRRRHRSGPSSPTATAVSPESPSSAAAEFPAGFGSRPGRHRRRKTVAIGKFRMGASNPSTEFPPATIPSRLFSLVVTQRPLQFSSRRCSLQPRVGFKPGWRK
ncbi:hypothetical protein CRENBAI_005031 [Crenichthys baileyi]|uniref:Uncharacterized protein n=1 Tax=Crenichthys baileyi TaxID=28760 RepID=A0AAV9S1G5_9TELE